MMEGLREKEREFEEQQQKEAEENLHAFITKESDKMWAALQTKNPEQLKIMKVTEETAKRLLSEGKDKLKEGLLKHYRKIWEGEGLIKPIQPKKSGFWSNFFCTLFMILFFVLMVMSKLNEEAWTLFGMGHTKEFVDFYEVLQVSPSASGKEIKSQYRKLAAMYHPDRNRDNPEARDMFLKLTEAGEVLGDAKKREMYDSSQGMGKFKNYINSKTTELTNANYDRLVLKSHQFWVVQVYDHDSNACISFQDTWEGLAKKYPYFRFGRIDQRHQQNLLPNLPFRPLEFPFVFIYQQDMPPEFIESRRGVDLVPQLTSTIKESLALKIKIIGVSEMVTLIKEGSSQTHVIYINRAGFEDISFLYQSGLHHEAVFMSTRADLYGLVNQWFTTNYPKLKLPKYIVIKPNSPDKPEFFQESFDKFSDILKSHAIPEISANNLNFFCRRPNLADVDPLDSICLLFAGESPKNQEILLSRASTELLSLGPTHPLHKKLTLARLSAQTQPHMHALLTFLAAKEETTPESAVFAYHPESSRILVIPDFKLSLQISGVEGLYEETLDAVNLRGHYSAELFEHVQNVDDLFNPEGFSYAKVGFLVLLVVVLRILVG